MNMLHDTLGYLGHISLCELHYVLLFGNGGGDSSWSVLACGNGLGRH
jgi:hypothetical protein